MFSMTKTSAPAPVTDLELEVEAAVDQAVVQAVEAAVDLDPEMAMDLETEAAVDLETDAQEAPTSMTSSVTSISVLITVPIEEFE